MAKLNADRRVDLVQLGVERGRFEMVRGVPLEWSVQLTGDLGPPIVLFPAGRFDRMYLISEVSNLKTGISMGMYLSCRSIVNGRIHYDWYVKLTHPSDQVSAYTPSDNKIPMGTLESFLARRQLYVTGRLSKAANLSLGSRKEYAAYMGSKGGEHIFWFVRKNGEDSKWNAAPASMGLYTADSGPCPISTEEMSFLKGDR